MLKVDQSHQALSKTAGSAMDRVAEATRNATNRALTFKMQGLKKDI